MKWLEYIALGILAIIFLIGLLLIGYCLLEVWWRSGFKDNDD
jgi:hypothetical protein